MKKLTIETLKDLSNQFGNAFYLLDSDIFEQNYKDLTEAFKEEYPYFNIAYSYKTNYIPKLVKTVNKLGGYAEVVSEMEMEIALRSGIQPKRIIWNGPVKNQNKVNELLLAGGTVNLDAIEEIENIKILAKQNPHCKINIGIRCNYDVDDSVLSRFGFDINGKDFSAVLDIIASLSNVHLVSLQAHFAKRHPQFWRARTYGMLEIYDWVVKKSGLYPEWLDLGGGIFGKIPDDLRKQLGIESITYSDYAINAARIIAEHFRGKEKKPQLFIEPGTAIAGNCMRFVCRVETIKVIRGKSFVSTTGSQKNISMNGINPPMEIIAGGEIQKKIVDADIVGYTCIEGDILRKNYTGYLAVGDFIIISNCGSYSVVMKPPFILPNCPVIDISGNKTEIIKRAETFADLFSTYSI